MEREGGRENGESIFMEESMQAPKRKNVQL